MTEKLVIIKTKHKLVPYLSALGISPRGEPEKVVTSVINDQVGARVTLEDGTGLALVEDGAIINGRIHMDISPRRRTGGCLIDEYTSLNVRPEDK